MGVSFVSGGMLNSNLTRDSNLAVNTNLLYLDVTGNRVGVNTSGPVSTFEVVGNVTVGNILIPNVGDVSVGNVKITNLANPIANSDAATREFVLSQVNGNITSIGNLVVNNTTITSSTANANIAIDPNGIGFFQIIGTNGFVVPVGTTAQRPSPAPQGTVRFNSDNLRLEVYDGSEWDQVVGGVTAQSFVGNGVQTDFTLNRTTTTDALLVMLNGLVQIPGTSYTVTPSPGTTLSFTEAPVVGDKIDVRFL